MRCAIALGSWGVNVTAWCPSVRGRGPDRGGRASPPMTPPAPARTYFRLPASVAAAVLWMLHRPRRRTACTCKCGAWLAPRPPRTSTVGSHGEVRWPHAWQASDGTRRSGLARPGSSKPPAPSGCGRDPVPSTRPWPLAGRAAYLIGEGVRVGVVPRQRHDDLPDVPDERAHEEGRVVVPAVRESL